MSRAPSWVETDPLQGKGEKVRPEAERWQVADGILLSVLSSLLLWGLIAAGIHASLT